MRAALCLLLLCACAESVRLSPLPQTAPKELPRAGGPSEADAFKLPPEGPAPRLQLPMPQRFELPSGTRVLIVERHTMPLVSVSVVWPIGALEDPPDRPGMASLCADLLDEGAGARKALDLAEAIARLGARLTTHASHNATVVHLQTLSQKIEPALALLADVLQRPTMSAKELARVKADTLTRLQQRADAPANIAQDVLDAALYGTGRRAAPAVGTAEAVAKVDHHDCRWWHRERLRPDDASLIVVGDVDPAGLRTLLEAKLSRFRARGKRKELPPLAKVPPQKRSLLAVDLPGKTQTQILVGEPSIPRNHPDYFPLLVLNTVLGGQFNSRLNLNLREKRGFAYGAGSEFAFGRDGGPFVMRAAVKGETTKDALSEMLKEVTVLRQSEVGEEELRQAKDVLARSLSRRFGSANEIGGELGQLEIFGLPENYYATYGERVDAVSTKDLSRVAQQYLDPTRMSIVLVGDRKDIDPAGELGLGTPAYQPVPGKQK